MHLQRPVIAFALSLLIVAPVSAQAPLTVGTYPPGVTAPLFIVPASGVNGSGTVTTACLTFPLLSQQCELAEGQFKYLDAAGNGFAIDFNTDGTAQFFSKAGANTAVVKASAFAAGTAPGTSGGFRLSNNLFLTSLNQAGDNTLNLIGLNASNQTVLAAAGSSVVSSSTGTTDLGTTAILWAHLNLANTLQTYQGVATAGWGAPAVYAAGNVAGATNTGTASIATYTVGAADGTFEVGCNILITTSSTHSFSCDVTYTDEASGSRTMVLPVTQLAGTFVTSGLITNVTGAGPYESPTMTIRAKATTVITVRTSAGGTFTGVVYNARGIIKQVS